jgi:uncharacterized protein (TIGR02246 family)
MRTRFIRPLGVCAAAAGLLALLAHATRPTAAQPPKNGDPAAEAALMKAAEAFVAAFNKGDAKAVAAFWTPDGDFTDQFGHKVTGREAIEKAFAGLFAEHKGVQLRIEITGLRFVTPDVAVEDGTTALIHPDGLPPAKTRYTNVHVRKDGQWLLESVRTSPYTPPSQREHLKGLDWLIGEWADDGEKGESAHFTFEWTGNQNFIVSHFTTTVRGLSVGGGTSWIAWDAAAKTIRAWVFESAGGFAEGTWAKDGAAWTFRTTATLPDGKKAAATNVVTRVDADTLTWAVKDRTLDGKPVPEISPVKMRRVTGASRIGK